MQQAARDRIMLQVTERQQTDPTIYFMTLDSDLRSGGRRVIYRHVDLLGSAGVPAAVLHQKPGSRYTWFANDTVVTNAVETPIGPSDILIVPEVHVDVIARRYKQLRHAVLNQSAYLTWSRDPDAVAAHYLSPQRPIAIITTSEHIADFARFSFPSTDVRQVRLSIDTAQFAPSETPPPPRIVYMSRRGEDEAFMAFRILEATGRLRGWEVRALSGLTESEVARELRSARIFLAVSSREGLGLPPLEAMASGCYVVGYHAIGGKEFMLPEFSSPVEVGNGLGLAQALDGAIRQELDQPGWLRSRGLAAARFVRDRYNVEREQADVLAAYGDLITGNTRIS